MVLKILRSFPVYCGLFPLTAGNEDKVTKKHSDNLSLYKSSTNETGWDRIKMMFSRDEFENISPEIFSVMQTSFMGSFVGACYGGFIFSRKAYTDFIEHNQATSFSSHLEAKKLLQNHVTVNFGKGALRWGWRIGLFSGSYVLISTMMQTYRGESRLIDYIAAGGFTGAMYRCHLGIRGFFVGGLLGSALGTFAGGSSLLLMRAAGTSAEEVRFWQYKWKLERDAIVQKHAAAAAAAKDSEHDALLKFHDKLHPKSEDSDVVK